MHFNKKLPMEVYAMEPRMKTFIENDAGAVQFVARYDETVASPEVQQSYMDWVIADFRERSLRKGAWLEGVESVARNMLKKNCDVQMIMECTNLTKEQIDSLR
jgi:hypothetical protein